MLIPANIIACKSASNWRVLTRFGVGIPILYRYIVREILTPFFVTLFVFTGVLFLARSLKLVDLVVNRNVPLSDILPLFSYIIPRFLEIAVPMSLLLATIIAFGRFSADSELVVIRAAGFSLKRLAVPVLCFASIALAATVLITFWIRPWANYRLALGMFEIARTQASAGLVAGTFNTLGQLTIYAENIEGNGARLNNVIIGDRRNPAVSQTFIAKHGKIVSDAKHRVLDLQLYDGSILEGMGRDFNVTSFEVTTVRLPHSELADENPERGGKKSAEMYIGELLSAIDKTSIQQSTGEKEEKERLRSHSRYLVEFHKRLVIPVSCLCVTLIALALGIQPSRGGHTWGPATNVAVGILTILVYYVLFAIVSAVGEQPHAPIALVMWIPNVLYASIGFYLFEKMGSEKWLAVTEALGDKLGAMARYFSERDSTADEAD